MSLKKLWKRLGKGARWVLAAVVGAAIATAVGILVTSGIKSATSPKPPPPLAPSVTGSASGGDVSGYVVPPSRAAAKPPKPGPDGCDNWRSWARANGGVDAQETHVQVYLEGRSARPIVIDGVRIAGLRRQAPLAGAVASCPIAHRLIVPRALNVDLDKTPPTVQYVQMKSSGEAVGSPSFLLNKGDVEEFYVTADTNRWFAAWRLEFQYQVAGERKTLVVDDHGRPFRTTATSRARFSSMGQ